MSPLAASYIDTNLNNGHERACGWGAGADCDCAKSQTRVYAVTSVFGGRQWIVSFFFDQEKAVTFARSARDKRWPEIKITGRTMRDYEYALFLERAEIDMDRIHDWQTD